MAHARSTSLFLLVAVLIAGCYINNSSATMQEADIFLQMAFQSQPISEFCNRTYDVIHNLTFTDALKTCAGLYLNETYNVDGIAALKKSSYTPVKELLAHAVSSGVALPNGYRLNPNSPELKLLNIRQFAALNVHPKSLMFLQSYRAVLTAVHSQLPKVNVTIEDIVMRYSAVNENMAREMIGAWFGMTSAEININITTYNTLNMSLLLNTTETVVLDMKFGDVLTTVIAKHDRTKMVYLSIPNFVLACQELTEHTTLQEGREACVRGMSLEVIPFYAADKFSLIQLYALLGQVDVKAMDYVGVTYHMSNISKRLAPIKDTPLILAAYGVGLVPNAFLKMTLVDITIKILERHISITKETRDLVTPLFEISLYTYSQIDPYVFSRLMIMEPAITDIKQLYSLSVDIIYSIMDGRVSKNRLLSTEIPRTIKVITQTNMTYLQRVYGKNFQNELAVKTILNLIGEMCGVSTDQLVGYFNLNTTSAPLLNKTNTFDQLKLLAPRKEFGTGDLFNDVSLYDFLMVAAYASPPNMTDFLLTLMPITSLPGRELMTSQPLHLIRDYVDDNVYNITVDDLKRYLQYVFYNYEYAAGSDVAQLFGDYNVTKLSAIYNVDVSRRLWKDVLVFVQKDVAFHKFLHIKYEDWPVQFRYCDVYKISCNIFRHFLRNSIHDFDTYNIDPKYADVIISVDFQKYKRLMNYTLEYLHNITYFDILANMSSVYNTLEHNVINETIIDHLRGLNLTAKDVETMMLDQIFLITTNFSLESMKYYYYFKDLLTDDMIYLLKKLNLESMNTTTLLKNTQPIGFGSGGILQLSWSDVLDFYLARISLTTLKAILNRRLLEYEQMSMERLIELSGNSIEYYNNKSVIQVAKDVLGVTKEQLLVAKILTEIDINTLFNVTVEQLKWILPNLKYLESTFNETKELVRNRDFTFWGSTLGGLAERANKYDLRERRRYYYNDFVSFLATLADVTEYNEMELADAFIQRIVPQGTDLLKIEKYRNMLYYRKMQFLTLPLQVVTIAQRFFEEIDICRSSLMYCNNTYQTAHCENSTNGYGYECVCSYGYRNYGYGCQDINECVDTYDACLPYSKCSNHIGGHICQGECRASFCPSDASCVRIDAGPACRCLGSKYFDTKKWKCVDGDRYIHIADLYFLNKAYKKNYGSLISSSFLNLAYYIETSVLRLLRKDFYTISAVKVTRIGGSVDIAVILSQNGSYIYPNPSDIRTRLVDAMMNGTVLSKLRPATYLTQTYQDIDKCALERPVLKGGRCDGEDYRVCERRGCPDNSNCTNTISGPICRCEVGQFLLQGRECVKGDYFIKVKDFKLLYEMYLPLYDDKTSKTFIEFSSYVESQLFRHLHAQIMTVADVTVLKFEQSYDYNMQVEFLIVLKKSFTEELATADAIEKLLAKDIRNGELGLLSPDPASNLFIEGASNLCEVNIYCTNPITGKQVDSNVGVYIGIPLTIMAIILAVVIYLLIRKKPNRIGVI